MPSFQKSLKNGSQLGIIFEYAQQPLPDAVAQAVIIGGDYVCLILAVNIFYGAGLQSLLKDALKALKRE
ncbi:sugar phosphate nucleotidyltransferase [Flavobacterium frigoris]|uniref:Glucose-1-phosphate thymidylyltransferase n=1 Tax=Flavobacterium frigoris (strain PS1) TaxID=1086011 RepID=H7FMN3_FLAFP|nr:sugar phosphate nucleotidyltransferase [Flavobacterium frigoris]EIA10245.1 glucose-1-phosphate thymidylyltransferase [Flavobacterium frigoris PS1]